jgi:hypothetical protein
LWILLAPKRQFLEAEMTKSFQLALITNISFLTLVPGSNLAAAGDLPQLTVAIRTESIQPAGAPILLTLSVTNSGDKPYYYHSWGPSYLSAGPFLAVITDNSGKVREAQMSNDHGRGLESGGVFKLLHGQTMDVPVCVDPLDPGSYKIEVRESKSAEGALIVKTGQRTSIVVKNDRELAKKWNADLLARIRKGEPFAQYVAGMYATRPLIDLLVQELLSNDSRIVGRAALVLLRVRELPDSSPAVISKAIDNHLAEVKQQGSSNAFLENLAALAAKVGTDDALEVVISLVRNQQVRGSAVWALGAFKQEKAIRELHRFLQDENEEFQFRAAQRLSERKDGEALEVLLMVAHDPKNPWRAYAVKSLSNYPDDLRVEPAIKSRLDDPDGFVRHSAESALRQLPNQKKQKP